MTESTFSTGEAEDDLCRFKEGIIENAYVMIVVMEQDGTVRIWNRAAEAITGYRADEVLNGKEVWKKIYPDPAYRRTITTRIKDILARNSYFENLETEVCTRNGEYRTIAWNTRNFETKQGVRAIAVGRDVTELKRAHDAIEELNEFREAIIDNANVLLAVMDRSGTVQVWNKAAEMISGYPAGDVIGRKDVWQRLYPDPAYRKEVTAQIHEKIGDKGSFSSYETIITARDGSRRIISWNSREISYRGGVRIIAVGTDITDQKDAELALVSYITEAAMRLKNPIEIIRDNLLDICSLMKSNQIGTDDVLALLGIQAQNASRILENLAELQSGIATKSRAIPESYRQFLMK